MATVASTYASSAKRGRITQQEADACTARVEGVTGYEALSDVDLVIEAVFEEMEVKKEVFRELDRVCKAGAILATNTSTLDVNEIARATSRPGSVIGLHFFSPAHIMKLLEIVRGAETDKPVIATSMQLAKRLGKIGVLVGVCHGFVGNRILYPYRREALFLVEEGASPQQVDRVITDFGLPMGPFAMSDLAGLDIGWRVRKAQGKPAGERYSGTIADRLCEQGHFGQKTGQGFYRYEGGSRTPKPYPELDALVLDTARELGIERRAIGDEEILERCIYPMINEGCRILEEGIALRASDIDIVWINGYGFPAYRGGPMFYGQLVGLDRVYETICRFRDQHGALWEPSPLLARLAESGGSFADV
jgi:3-hydroxyacyl-CoA dehydrogenase